MLISVSPSLSLSLSLCIGGGFTSKRGIFGKQAKPVTMLCVTYGQSETQCFTGGADGKVYHWNKNSLVTTVEAHQGPIFVVQAAEKVCVCVCVIDPTI